MLKLTRVVGARDLDWDDMRARCKRLLDRTEKAAKRVVESDEAPVQEEVLGGPVGSGSTLTGFLTPRQKLVQQQILRRRAQNGGE